MKKDKLSVNQSESSYGTEKREYEHLGDGEK